MKEDRFEIRFSGAGGQGIITAAIIFAEAAAIHESNYVCQTQSYGPEARGGKSKAEVVVSSRKIDYPKVIQLDMMLAMNQASCDAYFYDFKPNGLLLVDSTFVEHIPTSRVIAIPFTRIARETLGKEIVANMVALGAVAHFCDVVSSKSIETALSARAPKGTKGINQEAFRAGIKAAREIDLKHLPRSIFPEEVEV
jgi:2-oxoglutarate ferredoxin oxidoreductase subunit gamma